MVRDIILMLLIAFMGVEAHAVTADEILTDATGRYQTVKSISAQFSMQDNSGMVSGDIVISGDRFHLETPVLKVWYDGRTQWTLVTETNEVNVTEPTVEELQQVNPFAIISAFRNNYKASLLKSTANEYKIQLVPISSSGVTSVILQLNRPTLYPKSVEIHSKNTSPIVINVKNVSEGKSLPIGAFMFNQSQYPEAEIIDLR